MKCKKTPPGLLLVCLCFFLNFTAFKTVQARITTVYRDLNYTDLGAYVVAILYGGFAIAAFFTPKILHCLRHRGAFVLAATGYAALTIQGLLPAAIQKYKLDEIPTWVVYTLSCLVGLWAGVSS